MVHLRPGRRYLAADDGCEAAGQFIPFAKTKAERMANGDPRLSLEERYGDVETYSSKLQAAFDGLVRSGYLLPADAKVGFNRDVDYVTKNNLLPKK